MRNLLAAVDVKQTMKTRATLFLAAMFLAVIGPMMPASACSCLQPDPAEFLQTGEFVFVGSLIGREQAPAGQFEDITYTFSVDAVYVGDIRDTTIGIRSAPNGAACGFEVVPGEPVGIVANVQDGALRGGLCQTIGAADLEAAARAAGIEAYVPDDAAGPDTTVVAGEDDTDPAGSGNDAVLWIGGGALLVTAAALAVIRFRSSH